jgi:hypothetical protein
MMLMADPMVITPSRRRRSPDPLRRVTSQLGRERTPRTAAIAATGAQILMFPTSPILQMANKKAASMSHPARRVRATTLALDAAIAALVDRLVLIEGMVTPVRVISAQCSIPDR